MRRFHCTCGQEVLFEDNECPACRRMLGFNPATLEMLTAVAGGEDRPSFGDGASLRVCALRNHSVACNWLIPEKDEFAQCRSCRLTRTIPAQTIPVNVQRWKVLESAKRRLVYSLWLIMRFGVLAQQHC